MANFYRPQLGAGTGSGSVWYEKNSPGFNGYFKWHRLTYGTNPSSNNKGLNAPSGWQPPDDWTFSDKTGHWYTPGEMQNAGYNLIDGEWLHPNDIRQREVDRENAELDARIARREASESRFRKVRAAGRIKTILTGSNGVAGKALVKKEILQNSKGELK
ncbi:aminobutyrate aminotransferase [Maridesulfovibrio sp.]|uniref:aminobutyrate aminotransferase n=1 Tax=Maridesulfovibrio sp. TaxID=2795000 RepID=UPI002A188306|nr:aminobutyrate aminotransferase [Maridesulfovibrio sp.]